MVFGFRRFRATFFTSEKISKNKNKGESVVCLKYSILPEFESIYYTGDNALIITEVTKPKVKTIRKHANFTLPLKMPEDIMPKSEVTTDVEDADMKETEIKATRAITEDTIEKENVYSTNSTYNIKVENVQEQAIISKQNDKSDAPKKAPRKRNYSHSISTEEVPTDREYEKVPVLQTSVSLIEAKKKVEKKTEEIKSPRSILKKSGKYSNNDNVDSEKNKQTITSSISGPRNESSTLIYATQRSQNDELSQSQTSKIDENTYEKITSSKDQIKRDQSGTLSKEAEEVTNNADDKNIPANNQNALKDNTIESNEVQTNYVKLKSDNRANKDEVTNSSNYNNYEEFMKARLGGIVLNLADNISVTDSEGSTKDDIIEETSKEQNNITFRTEPTVTAISIKSGPVPTPRQKSISLSKDDSSSDTSI